LHVSVFEDDEGVGAAELEDDLLEGPARGGADGLAGAAAAGEGHGADDRMGDGAAA